MDFFGVSEDLIPISVAVDDSFIRLRLRGGLTTVTPVELFPRLKNATPQQRSHWRLIVKGDGINWPEADEDITVKGLIRLATFTSPANLSEIA